MNHDEVKAILAKHAAELGEHFDSVLILCTCPNPDNHATTLSAERGYGNFYAQYGHAKEWVAMQDEYQRCEARRRDAEANREDS